MEIRQQYDLIVSALEKAHLHYGQYSENSIQEALWMLLYVVDQSPMEDLDIRGAWGDKILTQQQLQKIELLLEKRIKNRIPLPYVVKTCWFAGMSFYIDDRAIIPRSYLVEWVTQGFSPWVDQNQVYNVLDLCTGSGCLAICCAFAFPEASITASDISKLALEVAQINVSNYKLEETITLIQGDGFENINQRFDLIACNPPYVSVNAAKNLPEEYKKEPQQAFISGDKGLDFMLLLLRQAKNYLTENGVLFIEAGTASEQLEDYFPEIPFTWLCTEYDEKVVLVLSAHDLRVYNDSFNKT